MGKIYTCQAQDLTMKYKLKIWPWLTLINYNSFHLNNKIPIFFHNTLQRLKHTHPSCFQILNNLWSFNFYNYNNLGELKMVFWGARKIPISFLKEIFQFGNHKHYEQSLNYKVGSMCHARDPKELKHLFSFHLNSNTILTP
jgi:hypothetical protein